MSAFDRISTRIPKEVRDYTSKTLDIVERIQSILDAANMTQKDLAEKLGKQPSEISRWMTGLHNFEIKTLVKIEEALGQEIIAIGNNNEAAFSIFKELPDDLKLEALHFIQYLKHKHESDAQPAGNQSIAKNISNYEQRKEEVAMFREEGTAEYIAKKKSGKK